MSSNNLANIMNISPSNKFIETLGDYIIENYNSKFSELKIFLPNSRLSRNLKKYLAKSQGIRTNEINIKSIAELDISDFNLDKNDIDTANLINYLLSIKPLNKISAIFWISHQIANNPDFFSQHSIKNFSQRYKIAKTIYELIEDLDKSQINPEDIAKNIEEIDHFNMAMHQQFTIEFFIKFYQSIKKHLQKNNLMFLQEYHNLLCDKFCELIKNKKFSQNIIIAGSTGSIFSSKKLIKTIANYSKGLVVIFGYKYIKNCPENHPKYYLNELINYCQINPQHILELENSKHLVSNPTRQNYLEMIFDDYKNFDIFFKNCQTFLYQENILKEISLAIDIYECNNHFEEANLIAQICKNYQKDNLKIGIICNNQKLSELLKLIIKTYQLNYNDSSSQTIFETDIINFLSLLYQVKFDDFNSNNFLAFIKHKYFRKPFNQDLIYNFEIKILRCDRESHDLKGFENIIKDDLLKKFFLQTYQNLPNDKNILSLIKSFEYFADDNFNNILSNSVAGIEIKNFIDILIHENFNFESIDDFRILFKDISYFEKFSFDSTIDILSPIEARLLNYDVIFVNSLNENDFPKNDNHGWIGVKTKSDLGINNSLKKIGQNANDFINYLSNKKVILTNSINRLDTINVESVFLTRLKTLNQILKINLHKKPEIILQNFSNLDRQYFLPQPCPQIPKIDLPTSYNITDISVLLKNPYAIFIKKILKLEELTPLDYQPENAEFGSFVHKALEEYVKDPQFNNFEEIFQKYFLSKSAKIIWYPKFLKFFDDFCQTNLPLQNHQNILEESISANLDFITLKGKVDRIILAENSATIIDYKTGKTPSKNAVLSGEEPQLLIYAYILSEGILKNYSLNELSYWKLNRADGSKIVKILDDEDAINLAIIEIKAGLKKIFDYFAEPNNGFFSTKNLENDHFQNLSRIAEWNK